MKTIALLIALASTAALADGVPFLKPGSPLTAASAAAARQGRPAKSVASVDVNRHAIDAKVITVDIEGKTYRFAGSKRALPESAGMPAPGASQPMPAEEGGELWEGATPEGDRALIGRSSRGVWGDFVVGGRHFMVTGPALFEVERAGGHRSYDEVTPQMIENARKRGVKQ